MFLVLASDNRPHMLLGLIVRSRQKRPSTDEKIQTKKSKSSESEPYEPPGLNESPEPATPPTKPSAQSASDSDALLDASGKITLTFR